MSDDTPITPRPEATEQTQGGSLQKQQQDSAAHFEKLAGVAEKAVEFFIQEKSKKTRFYKNPSFWTAVMAALTAVGLFVTVQVRVKTMMVDNLNREIQQIHTTRKSALDSVAKARILLLNQALNCPVTDKKRLIQMQQERNRSLTDIIADNSGLDFTGSKIALKLTRQIVNKIYYIKKSDICKINAEKTDNDLRLIETRFSMSLVRREHNIQSQLKKVQRSLLVL